MQNSNILVRRNHIDTIGAHAHAIFSLKHLHLRRTLQQLGHEPFCLSGPDEEPAQTRDSRSPAIAAKNCSNASSPPADPPIPTMYDGLPKPERLTAKFFLDGFMIPVSRVKER